VWSTPSVPISGDKIPPTTGPTTTTRPDIIHPITNPPPASAPTPSTIPDKPTSRPLTLKELFDTDFTSGGCNSEFTLTLKDGTKRIIPYRVLTDFLSRTKYLAFYVPDAPDAMGQCKYLAANLQMPFDAVSKAIEVTMYDAGGMSKTEYKDLVFTGRVFLYHETYFSLAQLAELEAFFIENKAAVEFRGHAYLVLHWHEKRVLPNMG